MSIEAELRVPFATAQVIRFHWTQPGDDVFVVEDAYRLDLSLTARPRNARGCYPEHWSPRRFERIGDVLFVPAGEVFHVRGDCASLASINCLLHAEPIRALFEDELEWNDRRLQASLDIPSASIRSLIMQLGEEARYPGFASQLLAELIAGQMAIELFRYGAAISDGPVSGGLAPWRLRIIDERLLELCTAPTLAELAGLCRLSVRQLTRGFRASRGCSIGKYVARSQIEHAKRLLATNESIQSIASSMGFAAPSNFSCAFRRATGQTPREFRQSERRAAHDA
jgi:AraC family transcriptional regulator